MATRPRFVRSGQDFTLALPSRFADPGDMLVGGHERSAAGVPSAYVLRVEPLLHVTVRMTEAEWPTVSTFLRAVQGQAFTFYVDADAAPATVYLESPAIGEEIRPTRDPEYPYVLELPLTLRRTTPTVWDVRYGA